MPEPQPEGLLEDTCRLARLHGWCAQTYELLDKTQAAMLGRPDTLPQMAAALRRRIESAGSSEERILCLALLRDTEIAPSEIADLAYTFLNGRLSRGDLVFVHQRLFRGISPIPDRITYDITQRVFISYQRALFQAMRVSEFTSDSPPDEVVLYLTLLLCLDSLNQQNRAMAHLLLSRIDTTLPPRVRSAVAEGLRALQDVIREVEERQESVLSDSLRAETGVAAEGWEVRRASVYEPRPAYSPLPRPVKHVADRPSLEPAAGGVESPAAPDGGDRGSFRRDALTLPATAQAAEASRAQAAPERDDAAASREGAGSPQAKRGRRPRAARAAGRRSDKATGDTALRAPAAQPRSGARAGMVSRMRAGGRLFAITFSRESSELAALLHTLRQAPGTRPQKRRASGRPARGWIRPAFRWLVVVIAAALLAVAAYAFVARSRGAHPGRVAPPTIIEPARAAAPGPAVDQARAAQPAAAPPASSSEARAAGPQGPLLERKAGELLWYPGRNDSLWVLYSQLRSSGGRQYGLESLVGGGWGEFLARISRLNPQIRIPDLIHPAEPVTVSRDSP